MARSSTSARSPTTGRAFGDWPRSIPRLALRWRLKTTVFVISDIPLRCLTINVSRKRSVNKSSLAWNEPLAYESLRHSAPDPASRREQRALTILIVASSLVALNALARAVGREGVPSFQAAVPLGLLAGVFFAFVVPWMLRKCPRRIKLTRNRVAVWRANSSELHSKWDAIRSYRVFSDRGYEVLEIEHSKRGSISIGLADEVEKSSVIDFIESQLIQTHG